MTQKVQQYELRCSDCNGHGETERAAELGGPLAFIECARCGGSGLLPCDCGRGSVSVLLPAGPRCPACEQEHSTRRRYVNAYEVSSRYGGPEEGGWWYDAGSPLGSVPVDSDEGEERARAELARIFGPDYEGQRHRTSAAGGDNLEIYIEDEPAAPFPATHPHYE